MTKRSGSSERTALELGRLLKAAKLAVVEDAVITRSYQSKAVEFDGQIVATISIAPVLVKDDFGNMRYEAVGFVHLNDLGRQIVNFPWSPDV